MELGNALRTAQKQYPEKTALIVEDRTWSYAELNDLTDRMAAALIDRGIGGGDRVALHFANGSDIASAYYACFKIGAIAVPLNTRMTGLELQYVLDHSGARLYLGQPELYRVIEPVRADVPGVEQFLLSGDSTAFTGVAPLTLLQQFPAPYADFPSVSDTAVAVILYTSGTTARPKGVTHTHGTLTELVRNGRALVDLQPSDVSGIVAPVCHVFGMAMLVTALSEGMTAVMIPRFEPELVLRRLQQHHVTMFGGLPVMFNAMVHFPGAATYDLSGLRCCVAGGDAVPTELFRRFKATFGVEITEGCGMTEAMLYSCNPPYGPKKPGSIGPVGPGAALRLVDADGHDVPLGEEGEILVQSAASMIGYWDDPGATAATIQDGWLRTGDLGRIDEDGYYWFVGRKKEIIIRGGSNISPVEVEEAIYRHSAVRECGVIGFPNEALGEIVLAFVSLKSGASVLEADLKAFVATQIAAYKVPESITFVPELPMGLTGKVHRKTLKEWAMKPA